MAVPRKMVRFPSEKSLEEVVLIEQAVCEEEKASVWYQPQDYDAIRKDVHDTVLELMQIEEDMRYWDTSKYTLRGIERRFSRKYRDQRRTVQRNTIAMVLKAQKEYGHKGPDVQKKIRNLSRMYSKAARVRAREVGHHDQFAAGLGGRLAQRPKLMYKPKATPVEGVVARRPSLIAQPA